MKVSTAARLRTMAGVLQLCRLTVITCRHTKSWDPHLLSRCSLHAARSLCPLICLLLNGRSIVSQPLHQHARCLGLMFSSVLRDVQHDILPVSFKCSMTGKHSLIDTCRTAVADNKASLLLQLPTTHVTA